MNPQTTALVIAIITAIIGPIVVYYATKPREKSVVYGIKIISPKNEQITGEFIEVKGTYAIKPPLDWLVGF